MLCARFGAAVGLVVLLGALVGAQDNRGKKIDPPKQMEGPVKTVDSKDADAPYVTITVKRMQPTSKEDVLQEVDKDFRFRVTASTKIVGLDGKPDKLRLKGLKTGDRVRIEYKDDLALEVKKLPPR